MLRVIRILRRGADLVAWSGLALLFVAYLFSDALNEYADRSTPAAAAAAAVRSARGAPTLAQPELETIFGSEGPGWLTIDGFMTAEEVLAARRDALAMEWGEGAVATIFDAARSHANKTHRSDSVMWVASSSEAEDGPLSSYGGAGLSAAIDRLRGVAAALQHHGDAPAHLGVPRRAQLARYAKGEHYSRHQDILTLGGMGSRLMAHIISSAVVVREVTAICYLNPVGWPFDSEEGHGDVPPHSKGELLLYPNAAGGAVETEVGEPHRIAPVGGRLVLFRSAMAHEVSRHESSHDRIALTVWIGGVAWIS
mmetsp:Transcript_102661/g.294188  ORF Transcript_102661/g.294188 Transcript_102661/m.294188 type:complete len:310 (-) Transcript_102661:1181-2110(-)